MTEENEDQKKQQNMLAAIVGGVVLAVGLYWIFSGPGSESNDDRADELRRRTRMADVINPPLLGDDFLSETGTRLATVEEAIGKLQRRNEQLIEELREREARLDKVQKDTRRTLNQATQQLERNRRRPGGGVVPAQASGDPFAANGVVGADGADGSERSGVVGSPRRMEIIHFEPAAIDGDDAARVMPAVLDPREGDYVPPNSYAPAKVLVGVDMSAGVGSGSDPKPVLFRVTGMARSVALPGQQAIEIDLSGCLVNGAASAELSSERVYVQLQKLTCERADGRVSEIAVQGYVSQTGKVGVRGRVVSREGEILLKALIAGTLGGIGRGVALSTNPITSLAGGAGNVNVDGGINTPSVAEIAIGATGEGVSTAADTVARYLIQRAEQYQPVVEMPTGIDVELVFLTGFVARGEP